MDEPSVFPPSSGTPWVPLIAGFVMGVGVVLLLILLRTAVFPPGGPHGPGAQFRRTQWAMIEWLARGAQPRDRYVLLTDGKRVLMMPNSPDELGGDWYGGVLIDPILYPGTTTGPFRGREVRQVSIRIDARQVYSPPRKQFAGHEPEVVVNPLLAPPTP